jgi:hypothetical protein
MNFWITLAIVALTYVGIALGGFPRLYTNRTTVTLISLVIGIVWITLFIWK